MFSYLFIILILVFFFVVVVVFLLRNCIGQNFAMNEMKVMAALTLKRYHLIEDPDFKPKMIPRLILRSLNGVHIKIKPVEPQV